MPTKKRIESWVKLAKQIKAENDGSIKLIGTTLALATSVIIPISFLLALQVVGGG